MKLKLISRLMVSILGAAALILLPIPASADLKLDANNGLNQVGGGGVNVENIFSTIVTILSIIIGGAAIIVIVLSGFRYIISGGDSNKVAAAKNSLIYALVGIVIAALAQWFVHFVLHKATNL